MSIDYNTEQYQESSEKMNNRTYKEGSRFA